MAAPIITLILSLLIAFLAFQTSTIDKQMPEQPAATAEAVDEPEIEISE